jgi:hypothetical protein
MSEQLSRAQLSEQSRTYWKQHIENWRSSGLTQADYCRQHELKDYKFTYWKKRCIPADSAITFVPLKIRRSLPASSDPGSSSLRLIMDKDLAIEIRPDFDPRLLRRLIATLRSLS